MTTGPRLAQLVSSCVFTAFSMFDIISFARHPLLMSIAIGYSQSFEEWASEYVILDPGDEEECRNARDGLGEHNLQDTAMLF